MRMYLSSFLLGNEPNELVRLAGPGARCALILNALDNAPEARERFLVSQTSTLSELGFSAVELDLRSLFSGDRAISDHLGAFDMVWVNGGNPFILRKAMKQSGLDAIPARIA